MSIEMYLWIISRCIIDDEGSGARFQSLSGRLKITKISKLNIRFVMFLLMQAFHYVILYPVGCHSASWFSRLSRYF
jgi:hypothetical protein